MSKIKIPQCHFQNDEFSNNQSQYAEQDHQINTYSCQSISPSTKQNQIQQEKVVIIGKSETQTQTQDQDSRQQSNKVQFTNWDFQQAGQLQMFINQMLKNDFSFLNSFWPNHSHQFINKIQNITSNWNMYRSSYQKVLEQFLHAFTFKVQKMPLFQYIYPGVTRMIKMVEKVQERKGNIDEIAQIDEQKTDILYQHYLLALESKKSQKGDYFIKDESTGVKKPIGEFIAETIEFNRGYGWEDIFFKARTMKQTLMILDEQQKNNMQKFINAMNEGKQVTMPTRLCCCPFFYYFFDLSDKSSKQQAHILINRKVKSLINNENEVTQVMMDICALLNSGGGAILFDTIKDCLQIMAKGQKILLRQYNNYKQIIERKLQKISPTITLNKNIRISLVPVLKNPYTDGIASDKLYIAGTFVLRIVVIPSQAQKIYYYKTNQQSLTVVIAENNKRVNLKGREGVKKMKKKWMYFYIPQSDYENQEERMFLQKPFSFIQNHHKCIEPIAGFFESQKRQKQIPTAESLQKSHKFMSLLVASRQYHQKIQALLKQLKIECRIATKYDQYKFKAAHNSAILFHDCPFNDLLNATHKKQSFIFQKRQTLVIAITEYLKLINRSGYSIMSEDDFQSLRKWMHQEHKNEKLEMWRFVTEDNKIEFYLKTQGRLSTIFMYYVLNHYAEKTTFKNPKDLDKILLKQKLEGKETRFTKFYPSEKR